MLESFMHLPLLLFKYFLLFVFGSVIHAEYLTLQIVFIIHPCLTSFYHSTMSCLSD